MDHDVTKAPASEAAPTGRGGSRATKAFWRRIREPLAQSRFVKNIIVGLLAQFVRLVRLTNRLVDGSAEVAGGAYAHLEPGIIALWHGQHLLTPAYYPKGRPLVAMVSRSADAELNALMIEKFGIEAVRGSGGRDSTRHLDKGGAKALIALKKSLVAGKKAPDIEGQDAEGSKFRLSDYRGKVVLLTFSANWCPPCRKLYPLERELVAKFKGEAFVMLSVSMDESIDTLKSSLASSEITWRCWWDGMDGPIWSAWNSPGAPAIFLLDDQGIIQDVRLNRTIPHEEFESAIRELLKKVPRPKTPSR